jgi:phage-related tail fiber protein
MPKQVQLRRGTTAQHATFTGAVGEVTIDTSKKVPVVHDGTTAGGTPCAKESAVTAVDNRVSNFGVITRTSDGAITQNAIVKVGSDASHVAQAGAADTPFGIALDAAGGAGVSIRVAMLTAGCEVPRKMIAANGSVIAGALLEPAASGQVTTLTGTVGTHHVLGRALQASVSAGDLIDTVTMYFLRVI